MSIEIKNIHKEFGSFTALHQVNFSVAKGHLVSLLGPSGCGKTTLLRMIAGLEFPDSGHIYFDGADMTNVPVQERNVGFMFQNYALFRHMTVFDNVAFGLRVKPRRQRPSKDEIQARVSHLLELIQLPHVAHRFPSELSGGQRQRVALARALAIKPRVLLLDEPFAALDAKVRKELREWLLHIHQELNMTSILVTHDQEEALELSDEIVLMRNGKVEQSGEGNLFFEHPNSAFVSQFMSDVTEYHGCIADRHWHYQDYCFPLKLHQTELPDGPAEAHVATHQWAITRQAQPKFMLHGVLLQVHNMGAWYRLEVQNPDTLEEVIVHIQVGKQLACKYRVGEHVYLTPRAMNLFPTD